MGYKQRLSTRIARRSYASVSICILVRSFGGAPNPNSRWNTPSRTRNLDTFQPSIITLTPISARMIVLAWPVSSRLAKMIAWHANELHCVRTDNPSRLDFFFQNPTSCLNAKNANQECNSETTNVAAIHRQSWPVNSSFTSSRSLSVIPNDSDIIRSELCIWCVSRNKPMCIDWIFSAIVGSSRVASALSSTYSRRGVVTSSGITSGAYAILCPFFASGSGARTMRRGRSEGMPFRRSNTGGFETTNSVKRGRRCVTGRRFFSVRSPETSSAESEAESSSPSSFQELLSLFFSNSSDAAHASVSSSFA
mmetsp:Transcript_14608/g.61622  ORF Transcript_14608/g.61622 Transcript_14608/m.61622 type:complete len:308 (-) Transcript_14608:784-1707(-)